MSSTSANLTLAATSGVVGAGFDYFLAGKLGQPKMEEAGGMVQKGKKTAGLVGLYVAAGSLLNSYANISKMMGKVNLPGSVGPSSTNALGIPCRSVGDGVGFATVSLLSKNQRKFSRLLINLAWGTIDSAVAHYLLGMAKVNVSSNSAACAYDTSDTSGTTARYKNTGRYRVPAQGGIVQYQNVGLTKTPGFPSSAGMSAY